MPLKFLIKPIFVLILFSLSISTPGLSQENDTIPFRNIYKFGVGKLLVRQFFFGYERILSRHFSLNAQLGYLGKAFYLETLSEYGIDREIRTVDAPRSQWFNKRAPTQSGYQINLEFRYYIAGFKERAFLGFRGGYQQVNFGKDVEITLADSGISPILASKILETTKQNSFFYGGMLGFNCIIGKEKKTALEFYLLVARRYSELIDPEPFVPNSNFNNFDRFNENHLNPVDRIHLELGVYLGIGQ